MFAFSSLRAPLTAFCLLLLVTGCDLNIVNPNEPSEEQVLTTTEGIEALAVGMQEYYATQTLAPVLLTTGTTSREVAVNNTFANLVNLEAGGADLPTNNANILQLWSRNYRVVQMAEDITEATPDLPFDAGTESGLLSLADLFKAMALGNIAQGFEQGPLTTDRENNTTFEPGEALFEDAITRLEDALARLNATPPSDAFLANIVAPGIDLRNTLQAYRARYLLFVGRFGDAIAAAEAVNPDATSTFPFDDQSPNPVWDNVFLTPNYAPREDFGSVETEPTDARRDFFLTGDTGGSAVNDLPVRTLAGFFGSASASIPLYMPGEMDLIRAEALVQTGNLADATAALNAVRTQAPDDDPLGVGADLDPYDGPLTADALLEAIHQERRAELFLQGVALEDMRRLGPSDPDPTDPFARSRNFYPYPDQERQNNPNTPTDPAI